jgi:CO/xanthine dehydrogenase FAD-binding subunit
MSDGYSAAIGARPGKAILIKDTEHIMSGSIKEDAINDFSDYIASHVPTQSNMRGSSKYRTHLIKVLTKRALTEMEEPHYGN